MWTKELGYEEGAASERGEAGERAAALETLASIVADHVAADPAADSDALLADLRRRAAAEEASTAAGVELATYHRAKGLEWDAVFLPMLEEGFLPIRQSFDDDAALEEERRLLYVGITRARVHLALSWAEQRETRGRESRRRPSRFLHGLVPRPSGAAAGPARDRRPRVVRATGWVRVACAAGGRIGAARGIAGVANATSAGRRRAGVRRRP